MTVGTKLKYSQSPVSSRQSRFCLRAGPASLYVLLALAKGPSHGLGIAENVSAFTKGSVLLGPGTLYRCLKGLSEDGLIERVPAPELHNPHRKYYRLTRRGIAELGSAAKELRQVTETAESRLGSLLPAEG